VNRKGDPSLTDQPVLAFQVALQRGSAGVALDTSELDEPPFIRVGEVDSVRADAVLPDRFRQARPAQELKETDLEVASHDHRLTALEHSANNTQARSAQAGQCVQAPVQVCGGGEAPPHGALQGSLHHFVVHDRS